MARILIIEDNEANLSLVEYLLSVAGHETFPARDGDEGMRRAMVCRPDLVVCDIQMPRLSGYEVLRLLRADPGLREVPVIAVTAYSMPNDRNNVLAAGFNSYLSKPIEPETFVAQIESLLPPNLRRGLASRQP